MSIHHPRTWEGRAFLATSLDGYVARRNHDLAWLTDPPPSAGHVEPQPSDAVPSYDVHLAGVDLVLLGRGTYEVVRRFDEWPYPDHQVLVLSHTLNHGDDRITVVRSTSEAVRTLTDRDSQAVYVDGAGVVSDWLARGLIDDLVLTRAPVVLSDGIALFGPVRDDLRFVHLGTSWNEHGYLTTHYRVVHPEPRTRRRPKPTQTPTPTPTPSDG